MVANDRLSGLSVKYGSYRVNTSIPMKMYCNFVSRSKVIVYFSFCDAYKWPEAKDGGVAIKSDRNKIKEILVQI